MGHAGQTGEAHEREVRITAGETTLEGELKIPSEARGIVIFAHGSGSGRHSPRNKFVARRIGESGLATLLFDLLTREEEEIDARTGHLRFDISLLARRLIEGFEWIRREGDTRGLRAGFFGSSTGGGAALVAAAELSDDVGAVVSRGGRPDLARRSLARVTAPTLLIVGGLDHTVIELNEEAYAQMHCEKRLRIVAGASHLFEEPGALEQVADLAADWFAAHLQREGGGGRRV